MHARKSANFCVSVCKTNFTDHPTPNTIHGFRDSPLICKMLFDDCYCRIRKNFEHFHSFLSSSASDYNGWTRWKETTSKYFETYLALHILIQTVLLLKNNLTNVCSEISKIGMNLWMVYTCMQDEYEELWKVKKMGRR